MITRCPACGTMFNVVADQLKVSQGWVRCGHCSDIFDASLHLQDVRPFESDGGQSDAVFASPADEAQQTSGVGKKASEPVLNDDFQQSLQAAIQASAVAKELNGEQPASQPVPLPEPVSQIVAVESRRALLNEEIEAEESLAVAESVSFVKDARRQAFWKKLWVRGVLIALALCLLAALLLQVLIQQKDHVVTLAPQLKSFFQTVCEPLGCQLAPLRKIEAIVIDSSTFAKVSPESYKLNFSIKNLGSVALAMPSLEVTLTDTQDQPLLRRVLLPPQFGAGAALLNPGVDFAGSVTLEVPATTAQRSSASAPLRVAGYRLLAFYP